MLTICEVMDTVYENPLELHYEEVNVKKFKAVLEGFYGGCVKKAWQISGYYRFWTIDLWDTFWSALASCVKKQAGKFGG